MLIHSVTAHSFGPFSAQRLDLADGMTVVVGDNESGKSSWHAAIYAALCGRRRGQGAGTVADREFRLRHQPWSGDDWLVTAILSLDDGRRIEMRQDLAGKVKCSATDLATGRDASDEIMVDGSPDASHWLGLDRSSFLATACVGQAHLLDVRSSANGLQTYLQRAATTATANATAAGAIELIEEFQRKHVGVDRANAIKPLRTAIKNRETAEAALLGARADHSEYLARMDKAEAAGIAEATARHELRECEAVVASAEAGRLGEIAERALFLHAACGGVAPSAGSSADELDHQVLSALTGYEGRPPEPQDLATTVASLDEQIARLPDLPDGDTAPHASVVSATDGVRRANMAIEAHTANRSAAAAGTTLPAADQRELLELAHTLETPLAPVPAQLRQRVDAARAATQVKVGRRHALLLVAGGFVAVVGLVLLAVGRPVVGGVALAVGLAFGVAAYRSRSANAAASAVTELAQAESALDAAEAETARQEQARTRANQRCAELGLEPQPAELRTMAVAIASADEARRAAEQWTARAEVLATALAEASAELHATLTARGEPIDADDAVALLAAADAYVRTCAGREAVAVEARNRAVLTAQREAARQAEERADRDRRARSDAVAELLAAADACALRSSDEATAYADLTAWRAARASERSAVTDKTRQWTELQTLLSGRSLDDLATDASQARQRAELLAVDGPVPDLKPADAERRLAALREAAKFAQIAAARANAEATEFAAHIESVAEAEEAFDAAERELDRVRSLERTLELTQQFLEAAEAEVHRSIAPMLNQSLTDHLADVTAGRYTDALVDPDDLSVKVCSTSRNWHSAEQLSFGTTEQIYLLLRAALADHLTRGHDTCPLILDDITVHADAVRTPAILDLLHTLSMERQVIVFTQEQQVADWARTHLTKNRDAVRDLDPVAVA